MLKKKTISQGDTLDNVIVNSAGKLDLAKMRKNSTLRRDVWEKLDDTLLEVARPRLTGIADLIDNNLADDSFGIGDMVSTYEKVSEMTEASVSMDGATPAQKDILTFSEASVPIPVFRKDFQLNQRQIVASQKRGSGLTPISQKKATESVADRMEDMVFNGVANLSVEGNQIYGYTNFPQRNTFSILTPWGGGSSDPLGDVEAMLQKARDDNFYGPFILYVSDDNWTFIDGDYSTVKGSKTFLERFLAYSGIVEVRSSKNLPDGNLVLVQMDREVVDLAVAQTIVNFEQPQKDRMIHDFTVMSLMAVRLKADEKGQCGIVHATGA